MNADLLRSKIFYSNKNYWIETKNIKKLEVLDTNRTKSTNNEIKEPTCQKKDVDTFSLKLNMILDNIKI